MTFRLRIPAAGLAALWILAWGSAFAQDNVAVPAGAGPAKPATLWTLEQVVGIAVAKHPQVGQADSDSLAAEARKGQAQSYYYPTIGLTAGYLRTRAFSSSAGGSATSKTRYLEGNGSLLITDFGRTTASVSRADALLTSARETGRSVREDVAFAAKIAYYAVLRARRIIEVDKETLRQRESLLRQAQAFYEAGLRARIDVARAEANLFSARADLTAAENDLLVARITLLNKMGVDGPKDFELADTLEETALPGFLDDWVREAENNRPDLRSLLERQRAAEEAVRVARGGHYPTVTANGSYGYASEDFPLDEVYSVNVQLSVPIFSGFLVRRQVMEAEAQLASARYAVDDFRRLVRLQVEQAALSMSGAIERTEALRKGRDASSENLRLATARYEVGAGDIIEMIDAQVQMTQADTSLINAFTDTSISVAALVRAIGR